MRMLDSTSAKPARRQEATELAPSVVVHVALRVPDLQPQLVEAAQQRFVGTVQDEASVLDRRRGDQTSRLHDATHLGEAGERIVERLHHRDQGADVDGGIGNVELIDRSLHERHVVDAVFRGVRTRIGELVIVDVDTGDLSGGLREADGDRARAAAHVDDPVLGTDRREHEVGVLGRAPVPHQELEAHGPPPSEERSSLPLRRFRTEYEAHPFVPGREARGRRR